MRNHMGVQVAVCTPGRMIDLIKMKACTCRRVTYLVFDEADRMFDMGFEPQARRSMGFNLDKKGLTLGFAVSKASLKAGC